MADTSHFHGVKGATAGSPGCFRGKIGMPEDGSGNDGRRGTNGCEWIIFYLEPSILSIKDRTLAGMEIAMVAIRDVAKIAVCDIRKRRF